MDLSIFTQIVKQLNPRILVEAHRPEEALNYMQQALAVDDRLIARTFATSSESDRLRYIQIICYHKDDGFSWLERRLFAFEGWTSPTLSLQCYNLVKSKMNVVPMNQLTRKHCIFFLIITSLSFSSSGCSLIGKVAPKVVSQLIISCIEKQDIEQCIPSGGSDEYERHMKDGFNAMMKQDCEAALKHFKKAEIERNNDNYVKEAIRMSERCLNQRGQKTTTPEQFIRDYYAGINNHRYNKTWNQLTASKANKTASFESYIKWWNKVNRVEVRNVKTINQSDYEALVNVEIWYDMRDGRFVREPKSRFYLVWDDDSHNWLINEVK